MVLDELAHAIAHASFDRINQCRKDWYRLGCRCAESGFVYG